MQIYISASLINFSSHFLKVKTDNVFYFIFSKSIPKSKYINLHKEVNK